MNEKHELMIQRLVDNELDEQGRTEFLRQAESNPELWRQAVLSFVEDCVWSSTVGFTGSSNQAGTNSKTNQTAAGDSIAKDGAGTENVVTTRQKPWWLQYGPQLMMTAASVLFVLTLALQLNPVGNRNAANDDLVANRSPESPSTEERTDPKDPLGPSGSQYASEPYRVRMNDVEVPVYEDPSRFRQEILKAGELDPAVLERFQQAGLRVQPDFRYIAGRLGDGRSVLVPVQSFRVKRIGQ